MKCEEVLVKLGKTIIGLRKGKGMTQQQLADAIEKPLAFIIGLEAGKADPTITDIYDLSIAFDMPTVDLYIGL